MSAAEPENGTGGKLFHMSLSVRGALSKSTREFRNQIVPMLQHDDGRPMSEHEARNALFDELAQGHEVIPIGDCDHFDYKKGCLGHPVSPTEPCPKLPSEAVSAHKQDITQDMTPFSWRI